MSLKDDNYSVLWEVCKNGGGDRYVELQNSVGQRWYIPLRHSKVHLSLFQPSSLQGKFVAHFFDVIKHFPTLLHIIHAQIVRLQFTKEFQEFVNDIFNTDHCTFGVFCGSPGYHQKPTLLISNGNHILGYCKLTDNKHVKDLFYDESKSLMYLHGKDVNNVPTSLFCGHLPFNKHAWAFVQTTCREKKVELATFTSQKLFEFVKDTNSKTKVIIPFCNSDFSKSLDELEQYLLLLDNVNMQNILRRGIKVVNANQNSFKYFCAAHGDLTPWNSFISKDVFFAFDLEYFKESYTHWYDFFHFFTQEMLYNKYANSEQIYLKYKYLRSILFGDQESIDMFYLSYLLMIFNFYLNRDKGILNERIKECMEIWASLINYILEDVEKNN